MQLVVHTTARCGSADGARAETKAMAVSIPEDAQFFGIQLSLSAFPDPQVEAPLAQAAKSRSGRRASGRPEGHRGPLRLSVARPASPWPAAWVSGAGWAG